MPNIVQYRDFHRGDNEWLDAGPPTDSSIDDWNEAWEMLRQENKEEGLPDDLKIVFSEDIYANEEYLDPPDWITVEIKDSGVLPFKMAKGILKSNAMEGLRSMRFTEHFDMWTPKDWGGVSYIRIDIYSDQAYLTFCPKHASGEVEVNITEQFNQAIGEA